MCIRDSLSSFCIWEWYCPAACVTSWEHLPWVQGDVATRNQRFWHDKGATFVFYDQGPNDYYHDTEKSYPPVSYTHLDVYKRQVHWCTS